MKILKMSWYEIKKVLRNRGVLILSVIIPVILAYFGSSFYPANITQDFLLALYNEDNSLLGNFSFILIKQFLDFESTIEIKNDEQLNQLIKEANYDSILIIPKGFTQDLINRNQTVLYIIPNPHKIQNSMMIYTGFKAVFDELAGIPEIKVGSTTEFLLQGGIGIDETRPKPEIKMLIPRASDGSLVVSPTTNLGINDMFAPIVAVVVILLLSMIGIASSIGQAREVGLLDLYISNGLKTWEFILSKIISYIVIGFVAGMFSWSMFRMLGVQSQANPWNLILLVLISVFSFTSFGLFLSSFLKTARATSFLVTAMIGGMLVFGGVLIPIPTGSILEKIANLFPVKYSLDGWRKITVLGYGLSDVSFEILILLGSGVIFFLASLMLIQATQET
ncbi:MAG: ABC-2 type transporter [Petrotoga mobilis]|nr:MAG: ABC-2 type transporter [Petrotoga mobilis]